MTVKRFMIDKKGGAYYLFDNGNLITISDGQPICDLLNELHEENQDLKAFNQDLNEELSVCANARISKDAWIKKLTEENEQLKKEVEMLRNGLKAYDEALPLYLDCEDIMHFNSSELFEFKMEQMDFYKKYPNRVHYK